jgi:hypothetical protein
LLSLWALGQAKEIIWLLSVILSFQVLSATCTFRNDYPDRFTANADVKFPFPRLNAFYGSIKAEFPSSTIAINAPDVTNALVSTLPVSLVDALDLMISSHYFLLEGCV